MLEQLLSHGWRTLRLQPPPEDPNTSSPSFEVLVCALTGASWPPFPRPPLILLNEQDTDVPAPLYDIGPLTAVTWNAAADVDTVVAPHLIYQSEMGGHHIAAYNMFFRAAIKKRVAFQMRVTYSVMPSSGDRTPGLQLLLVPREVPPSQPSQPTSPRRLLYGYFVPVRCDAPEVPPPERHKKRQRSDPMAATSGGAAGEATGLALLPQASVDRRSGSLQLPDEFRTCSLGPQQQEQQQFSSAAALSVSRSGSLPIVAMTGELNRRDSGSVGRDGENGGRDGGTSGRDGDIGSRDSRSPRPESSSAADSISRFGLGSVPSTSLCRSDAAGRKEDPLAVTGLQKRLLDLATPRTRADRLDLTSWRDSTKQLYKHGFIPATELRLHSSGEAFAALQPRGFQYLRSSLLPSEGGARPLALPSLPDFMAECLCERSHCGKSRMREDLWRLNAEGLQHALDLCVSPGKGLGVFARESIAAGDAVCEYVGEVVSEKQACQREDVYELESAGMRYIWDMKESESSAPASEILESQQQSRKRRQKGRQRGASAKAPPPPRSTSSADGVRHVIDATLCGNVGRFVNHSCEPNLCAVNVCLGPSFPEHTCMLVLLVASRDIAAGDELCLNYNERDVPDGLVPPDRIDVACCCGAAGCRGWLWLKQAQRGAKCRVTNANRSAPDDTF